ncbi:MAG: nuclease-related domain-containing protein, partial [Marmoricola sp.]
MRTRRELAAECRVFQRTEHAGATLSGEGGIVTDWIVRRWARYGHERLYAETPGGTALGYLDLKTGRYHSDDLSNLPLLEKAIGDHLASRAPTESEHTTPAETPDPVAAVADPAPRVWEDISGHRAGSAVREQALAAREAQGKVRHFLARVLDVKTEERAWRVGAAGEQAVAAQLAKLGPGWRVLHSIEVGDRGSDIDHVLIGPGGVIRSTPRTTRTR